MNEFNQIVGIGYNGFPRGCNDDLLPWDREGGNELDTKYMYVCHAEMNAILNINTANAILRKYVTELRNRGYNVKYPWTWKRVKKLLIGIAAVILILFIAWQIPAVRDPLVELYNENVIVKSLVDVVKGLIDAIFGVFKSN